MVVIGHIKQGMMMRSYSSFFDVCYKLQPIVEAIKKEEGTAYFVGGSVRDLIFGREIKDVDIEVHGLSLERLEKILQPFGIVMLVGKAFGVLRLAGLDVDWSIPRQDSKGRKPTVALNPYLTIELACRRRDLTMNAMAIDIHKVFNQLPTLQANLGDFNPLEDIEIIDPYGGLADIKNGCLQLVDKDLFLEDSLRFFRVMQFIGRFEMVPSAQLNQVCATMKLWDEQSNSPLARERIFEEIKKLFLKSKKPSLGFRWLKDIGRLAEVFSEIYALIGIAQRPDYHPEGDVFEHTMQSLDAAAMQTEYQKFSGGTAEDEKFLIMLAVLCHDFGKVITTDQNLHCKGHEEEGIPLVERFLDRITQDQFLITAVKKLVRNHCTPLALTGDQVTLKAYKRLAAKLAPEVALRHIGFVALADVLGRNPASSIPLTLETIRNNQDVFKEHQRRMVKFVSMAHEAQVMNGPEEPVLLGRHLLDVVQPGVELGKLLKKAYDIQIDEGIKDWKELKKRVLK